MIKKFNYHLSIIFRLCELEIAQSCFKQCQLHHVGWQTAHQSVGRTPVESGWMRCTLSKTYKHTEWCLLRVMEKKKTSKVVSTIITILVFPSLIKHVRGKAPVANLTTSFAMAVRTQNASWKWNLICCYVKLIVSKSRAEFFILSKTKRVSVCFIESNLLIESHGHEQPAWLTLPLQPTWKNANVGPGMETQNNTFKKQHVHPLYDSKLYSIYSYIKKKQTTQSMQKKSTYIYLIHISPNARCNHVVLLHLHVL